MQLRYRFRICPLPRQRAALARAFGCARVVFNDGLRARLEAHRAGLPQISDAELQKLVITRAKATPDRAWLKDVSSVVLVQALADLRSAYRHFYTSLNGERAGRRVGPPRFRSRKARRQAVRLTRNGFSIRSDGHLYIAKVGEIKVRWSRPLPTEPSSVTVVRDAVGRYFASFVVEVDGETLPEAGSEVGIDLGLSHFATMSDGSKVVNPRVFRRAGRQLRRAQRVLSRKQAGSANRAKARVKVARIHAKIADSRRDWLHKESTRIIRENQAVYLEDLCVTGLARTKLAASVHDAAWGTFVNMLAYKAARHGRTLAKIDRWYPSTRTCAACSTVGAKLPLHVRVWTCSSCGAVHDRDVNAAVNILAAGRAERLNASGDGMRPPHVGAAVSEAGTHRRAV